MTFISALLSATSVLLGQVLPSDPAVLNGRGVWPLQPTPAVVRTFDAPDSPWGAGHRGVDLAGLPGQRVRAALPGRVAYAGPLAGRGVVVVNHGETRTTYEPVTATVSIGDAVPAGGPIGRLVVPGSHCSPRACLHWGWLHREVYLDPLDLVRAGRVRLLPLSGLGSVPTALPPPPAASSGLDPTVLRALTRAGALVGMPSGGARW